MKQPLYGLILCGGYSSRLGQAKHLLLKENQSLYTWWLEHLKKYCSQVYISCRNEQIPGIDFESIIPDEFQNSGPLEGIYRAFKLNGQVDWLVVAVDLVYMDDAHLEILISNNHDPFDAVTFRNPVTGDSFPLCCIYRMQAFAQIETHYESAIKSPKMALQQMNTKSIILNDPKTIIGINTLLDLETWQNAHS